MKKIYLYGSGNRCRILLKLLENTDIEVCGVIDSDTSKWGEYISGYRILSPDTVRELMDAYICVTFYSSLVEEPIWHYLIDTYSVAPERILSFHEVLIRIYSQKNMVSDITYANPVRKILFDGSWKMGLGGVESWIKDITSGLQESNVENLYLITDKSQTDMPLILQNSILDFCMADTAQFAEQYVRKSVDFLLGELPCTIVFSRVDELLLAAYLVKRKYPDKIIIIMADHGSCDGMYRDILSYKDAIDYYMCVSTGIGKELIRRGVESTRVYMMTCPVKYDAFLKRNYPMNRELPLRIAYAGRLEIREKRVDILMKLILQLEKRNINYCFDIAGDGTQYIALENFIKEQKLEGRVTLLGRISNEKMGAFWKEHDIAINTSDNEGRPLSNMEAMIHGAVPVVTRTIGILDDVIDGKNGYVVPIEDANAMAERITYLEKNRPVLKVLGEQAQSDMLEKSDRKKHVEQWKNVLMME